jgi:beta-glucosidase/6-phospho-beta-glucosidase/beta-galactosidase
VPWGFHELLHYIHNAWGKASQNCTGQDIDIIVTENGYAGQDEGESSLGDIVNDVHRQDYYTGYIDAMARAVEEGVPVRGYLAWSLLE